VDFYVRIGSFKGLHDGAIVYFGPFLEQKLGGEYVVFLLDGKRTLTPKPGVSSSYGPVHYLEVFNQGYSAMETSYECVFGGKEPAQTCDYGVRACTDYIRLPKTVRTFSPESEPPFGCRWVRKPIFTSFLSSQLARNLRALSPMCRRRAAARRQGCVPPGIGDRKIWTKPLAACGGRGGAMGIAWVVERSPA